MTSFTNGPILILNYDIVEEIWVFYPPSKLRLWAVTSFVSSLEIDKRVLGISKGEPTSWAYEKVILKGKNVTSQGYIEYFGTYVKIL